MTCLPRWLRHSARIALHLAFDAAAVFYAYRAAYGIRFHSEWCASMVPVVGEDPGWALYRSLLFVVVPLWLAIFHYSSRLYTRPWLTVADRFLQILYGAVLGTLATLAVTYIYNRLEYSRLMMFLAGPIAAAFVSAAHLLVLRVDAWLSRIEETSPLLLVGGGKVAELVRENLLAHHPQMLILERETPPRPEEVAAIASRERVTEIVLVRTEQHRQGLLELAEACESAGVRFTMIPDILELRLGEVQMNDLLGVPAYRLQHTSLTRSNFAAKRAFDVVFGLLFLAAAAVPFLLVALFIKLDSKGPALFKQKRIGYKGRVFEAYKFRTMVQDAEKSLSTVRGEGGPSGGFFKAKADPRITRVGRWLRRFSLDEVPQFFNVLSGEMSVVGPRPLAVTTGELDDLMRLFGPTAKKRMNILPGITGLWQVSGRSDISSEQRFALDMFYIEHWSLGLDLEIILKTVPAMISAKGAY